jgi:O-antigen ligase
VAFRVALEQKHSLAHQLAVVLLVAALGWMLAVLGGQAGAMMPIVLTIGMLGMLMLFVSPFGGLVLLLTFVPVLTMTRFNLGAWIPDLWWTRTLAFVLAVALFIRMPFRGMRFSTNTFFEKAMLISAGIALLSVVVASRDLRVTLVHFSSQFLTPMLIYFLAINLIDTESRSRSVMKAMTASSFLLAGTILNQVYFKLPLPGIRAIDRSKDVEVFQYAGSAGNQNIAGLYLVALVPTALYLYFTSRSRYRYLYLIGIACSAVACYYTFSRKSWVSFLLAIVIFLSQRQYRKYLFIGVLVVIPIVLSLYPIFVESDIYKYRITNVETIETRERLLTVGLRVFADYPIIGVGYDNGIHKQAEYGVFFRARGRAGAYMDFHNSYLEELVEFGIIGFTFFMMVLLIPLKESFRLLRLNRTEPVVDPRYVYAFLGMAIPLYLSALGGGLLRDQRILIVLRTSFAILAMAPYSFGLSSTNKSPPELND